MLGISVAIRNKSVIENVTECTIVSKNVSTGLNGLPSYLLDRIVVAPDRIDLIETTDETLKRIVIVYDPSLSQGATKIIKNINKMIVINDGGLMETIDGVIDLAVITASSKEAASHEDDCEIWFDITQNDKDNDGLTYWEEINIFNTNPRMSDTDSDGCIDSRDFNPLDSGAGNVAFAYGTCVDTWSKNFWYEYTGFASGGGNASVCYEGTSARIDAYLYSNGVTFNYGGGETWYQCHSYLDVNLNEQNYIHPSKTKTVSIYFGCDSNGVAYSSGGPPYSGDYSFDIYIQLVKDGNVQCQQQAYHKAGTGYAGGIWNWNNEEIGVTFDTPMVKGNYEIRILFKFHTFATGSYAMGLDFSSLNSAPDCFVKINYLKVVI